MKTLLMSHNDADGYGASLLIGLASEVERTVHVARYSDIVPLLLEELHGPLTGRPDPVRVVLTDLGLDDHTLGALLEVDAVNERRAAAGLPLHRLDAVDHHASTITSLRQHRMYVAGERVAVYDIAERDGRATAQAGSVTINVDPSRSATRICFEEPSLYGGLLGRIAEDITDLVAAIDAVDVWRKESPWFSRGAIVVDVVDENVRSMFPDSDCAHEPYMNQVLLATARRLTGGDTAWLEAQGPAIRLEAVDAILAGDAGDDRRQTTRVRTSAHLARKGGLYRKVTTAAGAVRLTFAMEIGIFQRTSDLALADDPEGLYVNALRGGGLSLRSRNGSAAPLARLLGGGGHADAAGAALPGAPPISLDSAELKLRDALG